MVLTNLTISYPDFKIAEVIEPDHFDTNNADIKNKVNAIIGVLNQLTDATTDGASGADSVSLTAIAPYASTKLQAFLEEVIAKLKSTGGSAEIGTPTITGVTGTTVKDQLASLKALLDGHNTRIGTAETNITNLTTRATNVEGRATSLESRATSVESRTTALESGKADKSTTYTKTDVDTKLATKTDLTGDHKGTWHGLTPGTASEAINGARLDVLEAQNVDSATLVNGTSVLGSVVQEAPVKILSTVGKTDVIDMKGIFGVKHPTIEANGMREVVETTLHGLNGVKDELFRDTDGKLKKRVRFKEVVLDGSLGWLFDWDGAGYKGVRLPGVLTGTNLYHKVSKHNGKTISSSLTNQKASMTGADWSAIDNSLLYLMIADTDSGWGESYTPTADEIKAYFYGWYMSIQGTGTPYNGTGNKQWNQINPATGGFIPNTGTPTLPTILSPSFTTNDCYKLVYQLATERVEEVSTSGQVMLSEGDNTVSVKQGVIVKERAPITSPYGSGYAINYSFDGYYSPLKNKPNAIHAVYKNDKIDNDWIITYADTVASYGGKVRAELDASKFDPSATYTVTYEILPELTAKTEPIQVEYASSLKSLVEVNTHQIAEHETRLDGLHTVFARKTQEAWIPAILENGWVAQDPANWSTPAYYKDEFGIVRFKGLLRNTATPSSGSTIFKLPVGYRPALGELYSILSDGGAGIVTGRMDVVSDGRVIFIQGGTTGWFPLTGISFRAEK